MEHHAISRTELVHAVSIDPLSFYYASMAYLALRASLLHFLALVRVRVRNKTLRFAPSSLPLRLHLINLPADITHIIFDFLFHALVEDEKLRVLDKIGLCPHAGACLSPSSFFLRAGKCPVVRAFQLEPGREIDLVRNRLEAGRCVCRECSKRRRSARARLLSRNDGVCWVDHLPKTMCCSLAQQVGEDLSENEGVHHAEDCQARLVRQGAVLGRVFLSNAKQMTTLVGSFRLVLFSLPAVEEDRQDEDDSEHLDIKPAIIGFPVVTTPSFVYKDAPNFNLAYSGEGASVTHTPGSDYYDDLYAYGYVPIVPGRFKRTSGFRLPSRLPLPSDELHAQLKRLGSSLRLSLSGREAMYQQYDGTLWSNEEEEEAAAESRGGWEPSLMVLNKVSHDRLPSW